MKVMAEILELLPNERQLSRPLFANNTDYDEFREAFIEEVMPKQEKWQEARRKSEEESRQRLLR
jgi:hypothetical protein